jgi:predicted Zn-dependent peptidase
VDEAPALAGSSHFLEHLLFKGTKRRSALDISAAIEAVGGETNAFTTKEYTCYYARVLDADLPLAIDVISDLVTDSVLAPHDVETERAVILEEISMHEDEPGDDVHDLFAEAVYGGHPLGRLISGTPDTVGPMTRRQIQGFYHRRYEAPRMVVAAAGNLDHATVVKLVREGFGRSGRGSFAADAAGEPAPRRVGAPAPAHRARLMVRDKDTEQAHVVLGGPAIARDDERRFALGVLNNLLGGGMSSRLFQEIREKRGLAYSVYSFTSQYAGSGLFGVYAGCAPGKVDEVLALCRSELATVTGDVTDTEVARGKGMLKGSLVLGLEDTGSRMTRLAKGDLLYDELLGVDELLAKVDAVTMDDVREIAGEVLDQPMSLAAIGPFADHQFGDFR